jgi:hypothetical protein
MKVILTVPHARCPLHNKDHNCDVIAPAVGRALKSYLERQGMDVFLFMGNVPRTECDLNREGVRKTHWYKTVFNELRMGDVLIDVHSFPSDDRKFEGNDIVLYWFHQPNNLDFVNALVDNMRSDFMVATMEGNEYNTLVRDALKLGVKAVLIEFNEKNRGHEEQLAEVTGRAIKRLIP